MKSRFKSLIRCLLPRSIHKHRILAGPLRGCWIVTSWHDYPAAITGRTERPLLEWFSQNVKPGQTWLDVGAHYGYTAIALSRLVSPSGRVFAFEPMLNTAGYVTQTRHLNRFQQLTVLPFALGNPETLEIKQLPVTRGMLDSTIGNDGQELARQETMVLTRLDWLWPRVCGKTGQIDGIKIDVQGMEIDVLRGIMETLRRHQPKLIVEIHRNVDREKLLSIVEAAGYSPEGIPIEPSAEEVEPRYIDDRSYLFRTT